jgi:glycosyltransferase involved in cell wall biosynthesis
MHSMVAILLSTYNGASYLSIQIDSILAQTYTDWTLYIRDDQSTDNTVSVIQHYIEKHPNCIKLIHDNYGNVGIKRSFELLLTAVTADYYMFCDQDDYWLPNKIAITLAKIGQVEEQFPSMPILVHTDLVVVDEKLQRIHDSFWRYSAIYPSIIDAEFGYMAVVNSVTGCTALCNQLAKDKAIPFPSSITMHDAWIALCCMAYGKVDYVSDATILYRQHSNNAVGAQVNNRSLLHKVEHFTQIWRANKQQFAQAKLVKQLSVFDYINYKIRYNRYIQNK